MTNQDKPNPEKKEIVPGSIVDGTITHIAKFGAFVRVDSGEEGLVHISEIAHEFVNKIEDFVNIGDPVKIKILGRNDKGKLDLSIKQTKDKEVTPYLNTKKAYSTDFEDKINFFLKRSEEKQIDIRRNLKNKQGITKKRK